MQPHLELVGFDGRVVPQLLQHFAAPGPRASRLEVDGRAVVRNEIVARIQVCGLDVVVVVDDFPVWIEISMDAKALF